MAHAAPSLTLQELNRATLARQRLLARDHLPVADAVAAVGALQAQHPDWPPIALWSRLTDATAADLPSAFAARTVVRASLMRITVHVVTAADFWPMWTLLQAGRLDQWRLMTKLDPADRAVVRRLAPAVEAARAAIEEKPLRREELTKILEAAAPPSMRDLPNRGLSRYFMAVQPLVQVPEDGELYGRGRYTTAESWVGPPSDPAATDEAASRRHLIRRYLAAFGPASLGDMIAWLGRRSGMRDWRAALASLGDELVELRDPDGVTVWDLLDAPRPPADVAAPPRLLARWDSVLLAHEPKRRTRILPAEYHATVNLKNADVRPTFLIQGMVAGTWELERGPGAVRIVLRPVSRLRKADSDELAAEADRLAAFLAGGDGRREVIVARA
jgi:hypothetical protein